MVNTCCLKLRIFEKMTFSKLLKACSVMLKIVVCKCILNEDKFPNFDSFDVKKRTQEDERLDLNLIYYIK